LWGWLASENLAEVEQLSEALFSPYLSAGLVGALTIGLSAGIGEEILFRGAAQPRLGLVFTSLLFGVMHTQYTVSLALFQVFLVGLLLGLTRRHTNTTTAIGVHATFNFVLASMAIYGG
jgi:membrane protease YdiL (CAAX protease family)